MKSPNRQLFCVQYPFVQCIISNVHQSHEAETLSQRFLQLKVSVGTEGKGDCRTLF